MSIKVDLWTDIACPWCYVGHKSFKNSIINFKKKNPLCKIELTIHPYMIDPNTKKEGEDYLEYNKRRWGSDSWTIDLREKGKIIGCNFSNWKIWPNTLLSHKLILCGKQKNLSEEILEFLFDSTYEKGENVSLESYLNIVANKFNLNDWNNYSFEKDVIDEDIKAKDVYGIGGVPFFKFSDGSLIEGAQSEKLFDKILEKCIKK